MLKIVIVILCTFHRQAFQFSPVLLFAPSEEISRDAGFTFDELVSAREIKLLRDRMTSISTAVQGSSLMMMMMMMMMMMTTTMIRYLPLQSLCRMLLNCFQNGTIYKRLKQEQNA